MGNGSLFPESHVPREGGDPEAFRTDRWLALIWIPAFAGNAAERGWCLLVLRQVQHEEGWEILKRSNFLMPSSSKHEEEVP
ncbi:MAG: hypothetical protein RIT46_496 [Pseudomonadota bacterium]